LLNGEHRPEQLDGINLTYIKLTILKLFTMKYNDPFNASEFWSSIIQHYSPIIHDEESVGNIQVK